MEENKQALVNVYSGLQNPVGNLLSTLKTIIGQLGVEYLEASDRIKEAQEKLDEAADIVTRTYYK